MTVSSSSGSCSSSSSSGSTGGGFPNAATMGQLATNYGIISQEQCMIQAAILAAASNCPPHSGQFCTTVGGNTPMTFVGGLTSVTVVNGGAGYYQDTPKAIIVPPVGSPGVGAVLSLSTNGGSILAVNVVSGGTGYQPINSTMSVASVAGTGAVLQPLVNGQGAIAGINIAAAGTGYTVNDTVTAIRAVAMAPGYVNAVMVITAVGVTGNILNVAILNGGSGYQPSLPTVQIVSTLNPLLPYPMGVGLQTTVLTDISGVVTQIVVSNPGAGYVPFLPYLVISDVGTGATTQVTLTTPPGPTSVASIALTAPGENYDQLATGVVLNPPTAPLPSVPATVTINASVNQFGTDANAYYQAWAGTQCNAALSGQLNSVISYFKSLGYTISLQTNPATGTTLQWNICW